MPAILRSIIDCRSIISISVHRGLAILSPTHTHQASHQVLESTLKYLELCPLRKKALDQSQESWRGIQLVISVGMSHSSSYVHKANDPVNANWYIGLIPDDQKS
jgi:hypothetical protein